MYYLCVLYCTKHYICTKQPVGQASPASPANSPSSLCGVLRPDFIINTFCPARWLRPDSSDRAIQIKDCKLTNCPLSVFIYYTFYLLKTQLSATKNCLEFSINSSLASHHSGDRADCVRAV